MAYGLLSQIGTVPERMQALEARIARLPGAKNNLDQWQSSLALAQLQMVQLASLDGKIDLATKHLREALNAAEEFGRVNGYLGNTTYRTAVAALVFAVSMVRP